MKIEEAAALTDAFLTALNARERNAWVACFHPDLEGYSGLAAMESGAAYRGLQGAGEWFDNLVEVYETLEGRLQQTIVVDEHVLQLVDVTYVGRGSGIELAPVLTWVAEMRDGKYVYARSHFSIAEGFLDMGRRLGV